MRRRRATAIGLQGVLCLAVVACDAGPYALLDEVEVAYVIPNSGSWGAGDPCAEGDCGGPVDVGTLAESSWVVVESIPLVDDSAAGGGSVTVALNISHTSDDALTGGDAISVRAWGEDVDMVEDALEAGHEVWAATECPELEADYVCHFIAFDDQDRFAGLGYGAALYLTTPLAEAAAAADAASGRDFVESLLLGE